MENNSQDMLNDQGFSSRTLTTLRHRTAFLHAGKRDAPLMFFLHDWPEIGLLWYHQMEHFSGAGWQCIAPDMRGYGASSVPTQVSAYSVRELVTDMLELHNELGGTPAIWVGHDWGSAVAWSIASHHPARCRGVVNLCVPYFARGFSLPTFEPLINRGLYPAKRFPKSQWDYWMFYREGRQEADFLHADHLHLAHRPSRQDRVRQASPALLAASVSSSSDQMVLPLGKK